MCGIAGIYYWDGRVVDERTLRHMTDMLAHRGPDSAGYFVDGPVGLGNRRLAILDLSSRGHQPMSNEDGTVWVTYNGEIYNFREIREELEQRGHKFHSQTDTEVILHAYEEWGLECVKRFNGMFAFALWDSKRKGLVLVRDPLGIKPLFYKLEKGALYFGSEIKAILANPDVSRTLDEEALHLYLTYNYVPQPRTLFRGIQQLLPGEMLFIQNGKVQTITYWDWFPHESDTPHPIRYYEERLEELLNRAVRRTLVSDVPFGVFLSGGLDSTTVTHFMVQILSEPVRSFSVGFPEASYSELDAARRVAEYYGTKHTERVVHPEEVIDVLPKLVWHADEPLADASLVPTYFVSQLAREHVKMVLCGDGGDELFAGYETYTAYFLAKIYKYLPSFLQRLTRSLVLRLPVSERKYSLEMKLKRFVHAAKLPMQQIHAAWRVAFTEEQKNRLYTKDFAVQVRDLNPYTVYAEYVERAPARHPLHRLLYADLRFYLPSDLLAKVDRASMACSLEVRVPLLDIELVEFLATVPPHLKLRWWFQKKHLLRRTMSKYLPREILNRPKQGFVMPVGPWLRGPLRHFAEEVLLDPFLFRLGYFRKEAVEQLWKEHLEYRYNHEYALWGLLVFALWYKQFVKKLR